MFDYTIITLAPMFKCVMRIITFHISLLPSTASLNHSSPLLPVVYNLLLNLLVVEVRVNSIAIEWIDYSVTNHSKMLCKSNPFKAEVVRTWASIIIKSGYMSGKYLANGFTPLFPF